METQSKLLSKVPEGICSLIWLSHYSAILKTQRACPVLRSSLYKQISWEIPSILPKMGMWLSNQHFHTFAFFKADQPWILPCCSFLSFFFPTLRTSVLYFIKSKCSLCFCFFLSQDSCSVAMSGDPMNLFSRGILASLCSWDHPFLQQILIIECL